MLCSAKRYKRKKMKSTLLLSFLFVILLPFSYGQLDKFTIYGELNNGSELWKSQFHLLTREESTDSIDTWDMYEPRLPSWQSRFFSVVDTNINLSIDSRSDNNNTESTINLRYENTENAAGVLNITWSLLNDTNYEAVFMDYGSDNTYSIRVTNPMDMDQENYYNISYDGTIRYFRIILRSKPLELSKNISLFKGWNSFTPALASTNTESYLTIPVSAGRWNLVGNSAPDDILIDDLIFTDSAGNSSIWEEARSQGKVQACLSYYGSVGGDRPSFKGSCPSRLNPHDSYLRAGQGYWIKPHQDGNITIQGAGAQLYGTQFKWTRLRFVYNGETKNVWDAIDAGWIREEMYYWGEIFGVYDYRYIREDAGIGIRTYIPSGEATWLYSYYNNISIVS